MGNIYTKEIRDYCLAKDIVEDDFIDLVISDVFQSGLDFSECEQFEFEAQIEASIISVDDRLSS